MSDRGRYDPAQSSGVTGLPAILIGLGLLVLAVPVTIVAGVGVLSLVSRGAK